MTRFLRILFVVTAVMLLKSAPGQPAKRNFSPILNHPAYNTYAPYISAEGNMIVFVSDDAEDDQLTAFYSFRPTRSDWVEPRMFPKKDFFSRLCDVSS